MNLDDRAARASETLRRHVEPELDLGAAQREMRDHGARRRNDQRRARIATGALAILAAVGGLAIISAGGGSGNGNGPTRDGDGNSVTDGNGNSRTAADNRILESMPGSPIDGKQSWRLPVRVSPQSGFHDGDRTTIYGRGFEPGESLGIVHCSSEADTANDGVNACDLGTTGSFNNVQYADAGPDGTVVAEITIRRFISTPGGGNIDCASAAERCLIGIGAISNYDRSGGSYINFADAPAFPQPTFAITPNVELVPGQEIQATVTSWMPTRPIRIEQCLGAGDEERCETLLDGKAGPDGSFAATVVVNAAVIDDNGEAPCAGKCFIRANGIGITGATSAPFPDAISLVFVPGAAGVTTTTRPPAPTVTTTSLPDTTVPASVDPSQPVEGGPGPATATTSVGTAPSTEATANKDVVIIDGTPAPG
ncbi:MAG: neocarzinostatin apoprotein domain-containing protein [Aquihabitans sp.]